ncbi:keratin, type I cytoskeletal 9-like [Panicum virgatum]|uniref:keratin, type I cytoskeletal 9-like n=1 Tax=Panicum virgatum TaxID=38727 RepID=UPI0019D5D26F|nr:keratin, type I cytoskeletal 9-like [Panicum virgatum]
MAATHTGRGSGATFPAGGEAGRRLAGLALSQGSPAAPGRAAAAREPTQGGPAACAGGGGRRSRRRSDAGGRGNEGKKGQGAGGACGEAHHGLESGGGRPEKGVRRRGRSSAGTTMVAGSLELDPVGFGLNRARGWVEELRGEAAQLGARDIEAGWREVAGAASDDTSARAQLHVNARKEKGMRMRSLQSSQTDKARAKGEVRRRSRRVVVAGAVPVAGMGVGARTVQHRSSTVIILTEF